MGDPLHPARVDSHGLPTQTWIEHTFAPDTQTCLQHLIGLEVFPRPISCVCLSPNGRECKAALKQENPEDLRYYRCGRKKCRKRRCLLYRTAFTYSQKGADELIKIAYYWLCQDTHSSIVTKTGFHPETITKWLSACESLIVWDLSETEDYTKIGGPGVTVQIDESKFGKRKYHRGHHVEGVWVVGGVEINTVERRAFFVPVENRSAATLKNIMIDNLLPGTAVHTDLWKGYRDVDLREIDASHATVNHSLHFVDPETGIHTQNIEGTWSSLKRKTPIRKRTAGLIEGCLAVFIWRRKYTGHMWERFLSILQRLRFENDEERFVT